MSKYGGCSFCYFELFKIETKYLHVKFACVTLHQIIISHVLRWIVVQKVKVPQKSIEKLTRLVSFLHSVCCIVVSLGHQWKFLIDCSVFRVRVCSRNTITKCVGNCFKTPKDDIVHFELALKISNKQQQFHRLANFAERTFCLCANVSWKNLNVSSQRLNTYGLWLHNLHHMTMKY